LTALVDGAFNAPLLWPPAPVKHAVAGKVWILIPVWVRNYRECTMRRLPLTDKPYITERLRREFSSFPMREPMNCYTAFNNKYSNKAARLLELSSQLSDAPHSVNARYLACYILISCKEFIDEHKEGNPVDLFGEAIQTAYAVLRHAVLVQDAAFFVDPIPDNIDPDLNDNTYGLILSMVSTESYLSEPISLLRPRFERNGFPISSLPSWTALEAGCGNGRYAVALSRLGMRHVVGIDLDPSCIADAKERAQSYDIQNVEYQVGDATAMEFPDASFDFVFSNGVCEYVDNPRLCVTELLRVLKPGGVGFFNARAKNTGVHHDCVELVQSLTMGQSLAQASNFLGKLGLSPNTIYHYLSHVVTAVKQSFDEAECINLLSSAGAVNIKRLHRGAATDQVEQIYQNKCFARELFGKGDNRFYFEKSISGATS
jgi:ubiquinone/menaquinone biosynthesis C-methylase UbiE